MRRATLRRRSLVSRTLSSLLRGAIRTMHPMDPRTVRRLHWLILAIIVVGSVRLNLLVQGVPYGRARSAATAETSLSAFLAEVDYPASVLFARFRNQVLSQLPAHSWLTYRGKCIVIVDPTPYAKRSRRGKKQGQMQYIGRVKVSFKDKKGRQHEGTCPGYLDIWAGLLLKGRAVLPLARKLCSSAHPRFVSQNLLEEAVIWQALAAVGWRAILVADRGFRRKALLIKLLRRGVDFVIRLAANIHIYHQGQWRNILEVARELTPIGRVVWKEGKEHPIPCQVVALRAQLREEEDDPQECNPEVNLLVLFPLARNKEPLILATTLPIQGLWQVRAVVKLYEYRWAIETTFETMKSELHLDEFMVREWVAIERLLWAAAMSYTLLVLLYLQISEEGRRFLEEVSQLLRQRAVIGKQLTIGKLREAIFLDYTDHRKQWQAALQDTS